MTQTNTIKTSTENRDTLLRMLSGRTQDRLDLIEQEFERGFNVINQHHHVVTVFGSARFEETHPYYQKARDLGALLSNEGFTILTGGGGGIMEAANRGAFEAGGQSIGLNITLPHEQQLNPYLTESLAFHHFFARKVMLVFGSEALVCFPGGFGTMDELFETITLVQTGKMPALPIIMVGTEFWKPLDKLIREKFVEEGVISPTDVSLYHLTDNLEEVRDIIERQRESTSVFANIKTNTAQEQSN